MTKATSSKEGQALPGRILVAEDNKAIGDLVSRILGFMGFEAALARNGVEALSVSQELIRFGFDRPRDAYHGRLELVTLH